MSLHSSSDVPAAITWKSGFCMRSSHTRLHASLRLREIICLSFRRCGLHLRRSAHRCTTRVSVGCAPKWTAFPLSKHAAASQADMDEAGTTPTSIPVSNKISMHRPGRGASHDTGGPLSSTQSALPTQPTGIRELENCIAGQNRRFQSAGVSP